VKGFLDDPTHKFGTGPTHAFVQWKGTDVCMDFNCECGDFGHLDTMFAYFVKCQSCGTVWEMPCMLFPRKVEANGRDTVEANGRDTVTWEDES